MRFDVVTAGMLLAIGVLAGGSAQAQEEKLKFYVNFIGGPEIQFFAVVKRGVEDAGRDLGVDAIYSAPRCCDINLQAQTLKSNVAAQPDGIAVEFNDPKALSKPILDALDAGIEVILVNTQNFSEESDPRIKELAYVGQDEFTSGAKVGAGLLPHLKQGARVVCQNPGPAQIVQTVRCDGLKKFLEERSARPWTPWSIRHAEPGARRPRRLHEGQPRYRRDRQPEPGNRHHCLPVGREERCPGQGRPGGYDVSPAVLDCIKREITAFTLVQQAYAQGYLSVVNLYLRVKYGMTPSNVDTGTLLVTKENAAEFQPVVDPAAAAEAVR